MCTLPKCPRCGSEFAYEDGMYVRREEETRGTAAILDAVVAPGSGEREMLRS